MDIILQMARHLMEHAQDCRQMHIGQVLAVAQIHVRGRVTAVIIRKAVLVCPIQNHVRVICQVHSTVI